MLTNGFEGQIIISLKELKLINGLNFALSNPLKIKSDPIRANEDQAPKSSPPAPPSEK